VKQRVAVSLGTDLRLAARAVRSEQLHPPSSADGSSSSSSSVPPFMRPTASATARDAEKSVEQATAAIARIQARANAVTAFSPATDTGNGNRAAVVEEMRSVAAIVLEQLSFPNPVSRGRQTAAR